MMRSPESLELLSQAWRGQVKGPRLRLTFALGLLVFVVAMLIARIGTPPARFGAGALVVGVLLVVGFVLRREARVFADPVRTLRRIGATHAPGGDSRERAERAIRALSLLEAPARAGVSTELSQLHVHRALAAIPLEDVERGGKKVGRLLSLAALVLLAVNVAACARSPWAVVEGFDVLLARGNVAPFGMAWLTEPRISARPPDYLHQDERHLLAGGGTALPRGTLLTVRGVPVHDGRRLFLSDGVSEVPFVDDGAGHVVARWPLADTLDLRVVARFGDVVIPETDATAIESIPDFPPDVSLEGAPRRIVLSGPVDGPDGAEAEADVSEIPIHYEVTDDHGLREVQLVLRAGPREERRVLANLDGETKSDRGGHTLRTSDPFIKKSYAPIEIRVEAKDNDPVTGPKWGVSPAIVVVPPSVGEPEARRIAALGKVRDALVDALAWRLSTSVPADTKERREFLDQEAKLVDENLDRLEAALTASHAGIRVPPRVAALLRGRMRKLQEAVKNLTRSPSSAARADVVRASERMVLVVDATIAGLGLRDTRSAAKELADVADDLALAANLAQKAAEKDRAEQRMDAAVLVLEGGRSSLLRLGALGRDLGEIVGMDLSRVRRARSASPSPDLMHASLAAQDLAARLHQPDPSFGARGGRPGHAGGESGGGRGDSGTGEDAEDGDVEQAFNEAARDLEQLAADHAGEVGKTEQSLAAGSTEDDRKALAEEAKKHAAKVRDAARPLPAVGGGSDSWTGKGAAAREHAEQMARSLEQGNAADAVESGRSAMSALDEAKRAAGRDRWGRLGEDRPDKTVEDARRGIEAELKWAEDKLAELRKRAAQKAAPQLREHGDAENKLAERARDLSRKGRDQELPQGALDALEGAEQAARDAANALRQGDAERGLQKQREAQQKLEMARNALGEEGEGEQGEGEGEGTRSSGGGIPKADQHKGPEDFRKRVIKGLGQPSGGRLKDAVKRYAEGLLR